MDSFNFNPDDLNNLLSPFASAVSQKNRLFSIHFAEPAFDETLLAHTLRGEEHVSSPFELYIECLSTDNQCELKNLIGLGVNVVIHGGDYSDRTLSGIVTSAKQLGSNGDFTRYGLIVEPALSVLKHRRNSRVFQDKSVAHIVKIILDEHLAANPVFAQCFRHREQLTQNYSPRSYCQQYRESDFSFIERLLREEGISYFFDFEHGADNIGLHTLVLFDSGTELPVSEQSDIRFHRADATEDSDTLTEWNAHRQIHSGSISLASFDYKGVNALQGRDSSAQNHGDAGSGLIANLDDYDPQSLYYASDDTALNRYATLRQQNNDLNAKQFQGSGVVRALGAGQIFTLHDHPAHESDSEVDRQFVVLSQKIEARNNLPGEFTAPTLSNSAPFDSAQGAKRRWLSVVETPAAERTLTEAGYRNTFTAVRKSIPIVPSYVHTQHAKPTSRGPQTATVVGPANEEIFTDELGRIKIQFHWARAQDHDTGTHGASADKNDFSSCWVRVMMPSAGTSWGHQYIPRIGQEVLVDFIEDDIDRPVVLRVLHNGQHTPPTFSGAGSLPANKTLSGIKSAEYKGSRYNELVLDDTTHEIRVKLSSEHGKTQLNQGYLIHPRSAGKGLTRGEGFELRTDHAGAIRAAQGLLLTTEAQTAASGEQLDRSAALAQLEAAQNLTQHLGDAAQNQHATKPNSDPALNADPLKNKNPHLLLHGHGGAAITTPQSLVIATGQDLHQISQRDTNQTSGKRWIHNVGESISIFVANAQNKIKASLKLIAAKGDMLMQAQSNDIEITADKKITITACKETLTASAGKEFLLQSGGGYIKFSDGNIDIHCPGTLSMKAKSFAHESGSGADYNSIKPGIAGFDNTTLLGSIANSVLNQAAVVTSLFRKDGLTVQPFTGVEVSRPDQQDAKFNNLVGAGGVVSKLASTSSKATSLLSKEEHLSWLKNNGYKNVESHVASADHSEPVELVTLDMGKKLTMYVRQGSEPGKYATLPGTSAEKLAISPKGRSVVEMEITEPIQAVRSTVAEFPEGIYPGIGGRGGGTQFQLSVDYLEKVKFLEK